MKTFLILTVTHRQQPFNSSIPTTTTTSPQKDAQYCTPPPSRHWIYCCEFVQLNIYIYIAGHGETDLVSLVVSMCTVYRSVFANENFNYLARHLIQVKNSNWRVESFKRHFQKKISEALFLAEFQFLCRCFKRGLQIGILLDPFDFQIQIRIKTNYVSGSWLLKIFNHKILQKSGLKQMFS